MSPAKLTFHHKKRQKRNYLGILEVALQKKQNALCQHNEEGRQKHDDRRISTNYKSDCTI